MSYAERVLRAAQIDSRFSEEQSRAHQYLSVTTAEPIRHILQDTLLTPHLRHIIDMPGSGLDVMIDTEKTDDLSRLYRLFVTVPDGIPCLRRAVKESAIHRGKEFNNETPLDEMDDPEGGEEQAAPSGKGKGKARATTGAQSLALALKWVEDVLRLKDKFDAVWKDCFKLDREIESGLNEVCVMRNSCNGSILTPACRLSSHSSICSRERLNLSHSSSTRISRKGSKGSAQIRTSIPMFFLTHRPFL